MIRTIHRLTENIKQRAEEDSSTLKDLFKTTFKS